MQQVYNIIQLLVFIQGIFLSLIVLGNRKHLSNRYLGIFLLLLSLMGLGSTIDISLFPYPGIPLYFSCSVLFFGPLIYFYIWHGLFQGYSPKVPFLVHTTPAILYLIFTTYLLHKFGAERLVAGLIDVNPSTQLIYIVISTSQAISGLTYSIFSVRLLVIHRKSLKRWTKEKERFRWLLTVLIIFLGNWILVMINAIQGHNRMTVLDLLTALAHLLFLYTITFFSMKFPTFLSPKEVREEIRKKLNLDQDFIDETLKRLTKAEEDKFYHDSEITLHKMAKTIGLHSNALSYIINEMKGVGFRKYVNQLRLRDFLKLTEKKQQNFTLLDLAFEVGFSSKSTFLRSFREEYGCSPSEYIKNS